MWSWSFLYVENDSAHGKYRVRINFTSVYKLNVSAYKLGSVYTKFWFLSKLCMLRCVLPASLSHNFDIFITRIGYSYSH